MPQFFQFSFERVSFWLGFLAATLFWWVISRVRPMLPIWWKQANATAKLIERRNLSGMEDALLREALRRAQRQHVAAPLFALDEILVEPRLIAPPPTREPGAPELTLSIAGQVLPYLPDWPELITPLGAPTLTLAEALQNGRHIAVIGQPGIGKTVTLAHLASQLARGEITLRPQATNDDEPAGEITASPMPLYFHALDLDLTPSETGDPLQNLIKTLSGQVGVVYQGQLPKYIRTLFNDPARKVVLILDGLDELPPARLANTITYLVSLLEKYGQPVESLQMHPKLQAVIAGPADYLDGLTKAGFYPLGVASWTHRQRAELAQKWGQTWNEQFLPEVKKHHAAEPVNLFMMNAWLEDESAITSPLEWVLRVWGAYAGDISGSNHMGLIDAHLTRFLPSSTFVLALEEVAHTMVQYESSAMRYEEMEKILTAFRPTTPVSMEMAMEAQAGPIPLTASFKLPAAIKFPAWRKPPSEGAAAIAEGDAPLEAAQDAEPEPQAEPAPPAESAQLAEEEKPKKKKKGRRGGDIISSQGEQILDALLNAGVLVQHSGGLLRFASPVFLGYLAGMRVTEEEAEVLAGALDWPVNQQTLQYTAACSDTPNWISLLMMDSGAPLCRDLLRVARWLRDAPPDAAWRTTFMRAMIGLLQMETLPTGTRARLTAAFVLSGDPSIPRLFKQLLGSKSRGVCQMALMGSGALGAGAAGGADLISDILSMVRDSAPAVRYAACLALSAMPDKEALETVVRILVEGDEDLRQAAAEALAQMPPEGYKVLEEAAGEEDLLTRRASVFGLAQIHETWAHKALEKLAVEDAQWVVRNAAAQALESLQTANPSIPKPIPPASEAAWLLAFASKLGLGLVPGAPATDVLLQVLKSGSVEEQGLALQYLREIPDEGIVGAIYNLIYGDQDSLREPALNALWWMSLSGKPLPSPTMFGLG